MIFRIVSFYLFIFTTCVYALPIDWHGELMFDYFFLENYRRQDTNNSPSANASGGQILPIARSHKQNASFQTYLLRLNPSLIVNDSTTIFGEVITGYARSGFLGDSSATRKEREIPEANNSGTGGKTQITNNDGTRRVFGNALYFHNTASGKSNVQISQIYTKLYSDFATYTLGRHPVHWGLGAIYNSGEKEGERHQSLRDGIMAELKVGNFTFSPHWALINSTDQLTTATNTKDFGVTLVYDNSDRDLVLGLLLGKRKSSGNDLTNKGAFNANLGTSRDLGAASVKIFDIYFEKLWGNFSVRAEFPMLSGSMGNVYSHDFRVATSNIDIDYKGKAILFETKYKFNEDWHIGFDFGEISGDNGESTEFKALYLHPNYQIANLLFRYNLRAITEHQKNTSTDASVFDSYMVNARYAKLYLNYYNESWKWYFAAIYAEAREVAETSASGDAGAFNHEQNIVFSVNGGAEDQNKEMGIEIDAGFRYKWNENVTLRGDFAYHIVGDYFAFSNDPAFKSDLSNVTFGMVSLGINF